ncbi:MAG: hypothetical protein SPI61_07345 [Ezakiella sp.]|uniref:hypothetical protein n=1 Tax=Ezakiella sp. TaxID=1935205 RepID=UPI0029713B28|nr:hypothetical protein [Ezakiella sp.]MDD7731439.1 hypothetical protein [Eubacteriales bacterium]MDY6080521.1 hypothetical protein [Ezakiella sp.]
MKNRFIKFFIIFIIFVAIAGCGKKRQNKNQMFSTTKSVKDTIEEEMKKEQEKKENAENEKALKNDFQATEEDVKEINEDKNEENKKAENVGEENKKDIDYDLTEMNSDMIYATVFMVVQDPESYAGKTFKIYGNSYTFPTTEGKSMTHYCLIKDALACCAQGLEFISSNSDEKYPDDGDEIVVTGTLESYTVEDIPMPLCRLVNAKIEKKTNEK